MQTFGIDHMVRCRAATREKFSTSAMNRPCVMCKTHCQKTGAVLVHIDNRKVTMIRISYADMLAVSPTSSKAAMTSVTERVLFCFASMVSIMACARQKHSNGALSMRGCFSACSVRGYFPARSGVPCGETRSIRLLPWAPGTGFCESGWKPAASWSCCKTSVWVEAWCFGVKLWNAALARCVSL